MCFRALRRRTPLLRALRARPAARRRRRSARRPPRTAGPATPRFPPRVGDRHAGPAAPVVGLRPAGAAHFLSPPRVDDWNGWGVPLPRPGVRRMGIVYQAGTRKCGGCVHSSDEAGAGRQRSARSGSCARPGPPPPSSTDTSCPSTRSARPRVPFIAMQLLQGDLAERVGARTLPAAKCSHRPEICRGLKRPGSGWCTATSSRPTSGWRRTRPGQNPGLGLAARRPTRPVGREAT